MQKPFDNKIYEKLFEDLYEPLCRYCFKFVEDIETAEDIVADQFAYVWENWDRLKTYENKQSYLYKAVRNKSINLLLRNNKFTNTELNEIDQDMEYSEWPSPQELLDKKELEKIIEDAFKKLPDKCRQIFKLSRFAELSNKEIAEKLNIAIKTVEAHNTLAMKRIRLYISEHWDAFIIMVLSGWFNLL